MHQCTGEDPRPLSPTQQRVKDLLGRGLSVREVSSLLNISTQATYKTMKVLGIPPPSRRSESVRESAA